MEITVKVGHRTLLGTLYMDTCSYERFSQVVFNITGQLTLALLLAPFGLTGKDNVVAFHLVTDFLTFEQFVQYGRDRL